MSRSPAGSSKQGPDRPGTAHGCVCIRLSCEQLLIFGQGYYNPMLAYGEDKAIQDAYEAGANGFIIVDLPPEEAVSFRDKCRKAKYAPNLPQ